MEEQEKQGWFDKLFDAFSKDVKTTTIVLLTMALALFIRLWISATNSRDDLKTEMYERVITEMKHEVKEQVKPIKESTDSTNARVNTTLSKVDTTADNLNNYIKHKK